MEGKLMKMSLVLIACVSALALTACATPNGSSYNPDHSVNDPKYAGVADHRDMRRRALGPWESHGR